MRWDESLAVLRPTGPHLRLPCPARVGRLRGQQARDDQTGSVESRVHRPGQTARNDNAEAGSEKAKVRNGIAARTADSSGFGEGGL